MKKSFSILLVVTFLVYFAGFYIYFTLRLVEIRQEMRSKLRLLPKTQLNRLTLSAEEFRESKVEEDEIKVNNKMYDIAWIETKGLEITVYCLRDETEDNLLSFLDEVLKNASNDKKQLPSGVFSLLEMEALPNAIQLKNVVSRNEKNVTVYSVHSCSFEPQLTTPPPRV